MRLRPFGWWSDSWRVYALGVLSICFGVSGIGGIAFWGDLPAPKGLSAALVAAAGAIVGLFSGLCAGVAYRFVDTGLHPVARWLGLLVVSGAIPVALLMLGFGARFAGAVQLTAPLIALQAGWTAVFLIGRRPRPARQPLPPIPEPAPRGWDSRH